MIEIFLFLKLENTCETLIIVILTVLSITLVISISDTIDKKLFIYFDIFPFFLLIPISFYNSTIFFFLLAEECNG